MKKKIFSVILMLCMFVTSSSIVFAIGEGDIEGNFHIDKNLSKTGVTITVSDDIDEKIPEFMIDDIIKEHPDAGEITFYEYKDYEDVDEGNYKNTSPLSQQFDLAEENFINPENIQINSKGYFTTGPVKTTKKVTIKNQIAKEEFKFSVAKGETVTLSQSYKGSLKGSYTGRPLNLGDLGVTTTVTGEFKKGTKYNGPSESSSYNCREFYMRFYQNVGTYKQTQNTYYNYAGHKTLYDTKTKTGTYKQAIKFSSFSVDKKI
ncbi:hypothetical protein [Anaerovorax odorimutans]|uniref:hypothetical protein n=1 Tax=Anaerovorax odorimutans TaxID=109327 RepID=UPI0004218B13|nr:hypothetical protein [Anaerovorax odorimutans]